MTWAEILPALAVSIAFVVIPGWAVLAALGIRGVAAIAGAPAATLGMIAAATVILPAAGIGWSIGAVGIFLSLIVAVVFGVRFGVQRMGRLEPAASPPGDGRPAVAGFVIGALAGGALIGIRLASAIGSPESISQTFDNVFHLNAIRYLVDVGDASPFHLASLTYDVNGLGSFYPSLWHALAALIVGAGAADVPTAANLVNLVLAGVVWTFSCMLLMRQLVGARGAALAATGLLASCSALFPYLLLDFGVLTPNALSVSALPAALAWTITVLGLSSAPRGGRIAAIAAAALTVVGLGLAHPSSVFALMVLAAPAAAVAVGRWWVAARSRARSRWIGGAAIAVGVAIAVVVFLLVRPTREAAFWPPSMSYGDAVTSVLLGSEAYRGAAPALTVAAAAGVVALLVLRRQRWLVASLALILLQYVAVAALHVGRLRYLLTGTWYSDMYRIAALLPVLLIPLAAIGAIWVGELLVRAVARVRDRTAERAPRAPAPPFARQGAAGAAAGLAIAVSLTVTAQFGDALGRASGSLAAVHATTDESALLSTDERRLLSRLPEHVPADGVVVGSPWTGASLAYALADRRTLVPHIFSAIDADQQAILDGLDGTLTDDAVCDVVRRLGVTHVLDFGEREVHGGSHVFAGLDELDRSGAVELVDREGSAELYRITACE